MADQAASALREPRDGDTFNLTPRQLAEIDAALDNADLDSIARGRLLLRKVRASQGRLDYDTLLDLTQDAIQLLASEEFTPDYLDAMALNAGLNAVAGNVTVSLNQCVRLARIDGLTSRARSNIGVAFHRMGAFDLAAQTWAHALETALDDADPSDFVVGCVVNLMSAVSRSDLMGQSTDLESTRRSHLDMATRALDHLPEVDGALATTVPMHRATIAAFRGDLDAAVSLWGAVDATTIHPNEIVCLHFCAIETRLALHQRNFQRAMELINFSLRERSIERSLRLGRVEAQVRLVELHRLQGDHEAEAAAAITLTEITLTEGSDLPRMLVAETRQRIALEDRQEDLALWAAELNRQVSTDRVTGLASRWAVDQRLENIRPDDETPVGVLVLDIDHFKRVNDRSGHKTGDAALAEVGTLLRETCGPEVLSARHGGDEFLILFDNADLDQTVALAERIRSICARWDWQKLGHETPVTCSIGVAVGPMHNAEQLIEVADRALYLAKESGRNRVEVAYHDSVDAALDGFAAEIVEAVETGQLMVLYQPIWDLRTGSAVGFESLVRWQHPTRGLLTPGEFIGAAEAVGVIDRIDRFVLRQACNDLAQLAEDPDLAHLHIAINVSAIDFSRLDLPTVVSAELRRREIAPSSLVIEVTESAVMENMPIAAGQLAELSALGVRLSLDDFGTGYSSLAQLDQLDVHILKADRSFVERSDGSTTVLSTILDLGQALELETVVEGIESFTALRTARRLGAGFGQGYLLASPASLADCLSLIRSTIDSGHAAMGIVSDDSAGDDG